MKGSYVLLIKLKNKTKINVGKLGIIHLNKGYFVYIGSALNGLEKRIQRHLKIQKKLHWHIDYLLEKGKILDVFFQESEVKEECNIANNFNKLQQIDGFGCSDCKCKSHLFFGTIDEISTIVEKLDLHIFNNFSD
jgi:Uri superfamily endonuclease